MPDLELIQYLDGKFGDADRKRSDGLTVIHNKVDSLRNDFNASEIARAARAVELASRVDIVHAEVKSVAKSLDEHMENDDERFGAIGTADERKEDRREGRWRIVGASLLAATLGYLAKLIGEE